MGPNYPFKPKACPPTPMSATHVNTLLALMRLHTGDPASLHNFDTISRAIADSAKAWAAASWLRGGRVGFRPLTPTPMMVVCQWDSHLWGLYLLKCWSMKKYSLRT